MSSPEVTIAIPFRNPGAELVLAVQSVFAQTFTNWELILCDDGSDDGSLEFVHSLNDPRVRVLSDGLGKGLAPRLNETIRAARGEFYFRMDADDAMHPDRVQTQLQVLRNGPASTIVGTASYSMDLDSQTVGIRPARKRPGKAFEARHNLLHPTVAARTDWFRNNPYSEKAVYFRSEDAELWCRTANSSNVIILPRPLMYIREGGVFYFTKYIGTCVGVLQLVREYNRNSMETCYLLSRELGKIWLTSILDAMGKAHWVVDRRFQKIEPKSQREAEAAMERVKQQSLPTTRCLVRSADRNQDSHGSARAFLQEQAH